VLLSVMTSALSFAACHQDTITSFMYLSVRLFSEIDVAVRMVYYAVGLGCYGQTGM
jgi:hypothetical protein